MSNLFDMSSLASHSVFGLTDTVIVLYSSIFGPFIKTAVTRYFCAEICQSLSIIIKELALNRFGINSTVF